MPVNLFPVTPWSHLIQATIINERVKMQSRHGLKYCRLLRIQEEWELCLATGQLLTDDETRMWLMHNADIPDVAAEHEVFMARPIA